MTVAWPGPDLDADQHDLVRMLDALASDRDLVLDDDVAQVDALVTELAELDIWTIGTSERSGGGGADHLTASLAFHCLGRHWPSLGWAAVQAHAAVSILGQNEDAAELVDQIHAGRARVAVVEADSVRAHLAFTDGALTGTVDRADAAGPSPHLLVMDGADRAHLVPPESLETEALRRTGLGGAFTRRLVVDDRGGPVSSWSGLELAPARATLWLGAGAVASGIATAASADALGYTQQRHQFGRPLTALPTMRQSLAHQAARITTAARSAAAASGDAVAAWGVAREACEAAVEVAAAALQCHGGYGYLKEYAAERRLRDAVSLRAATDTASGAVTAGAALVGAEVKSSSIGSES